jgi:2,3-bisphosphoglycerate-independent phosphoglycerate mutase
VRVLMLFLDGVGIGKKDPDINPFFAGELATMRSLFSGDLPSVHHQRLEGKAATLIPLDATLGVDGLPQSGTGQTALFTGENGARIVGKHFGPYPYSTLRPVIAEKNIFRQLQAMGKNVCFANAFPQRFFDYIAKRPGRISVTTTSCLQSGVPLMREEDLRAARAVSADLTGKGWHSLGHPDVPVIEPFEAGHRLSRLLGSHDFVLFEYWKTDYAGHSGSMAEAVACLEDFDRLLAGVVEELDTRRDLLIITSDHGNIEDMSVKTHTRHPVPAALYGFRHKEFASFLDQHSSRVDISRVTPAILHFLHRSA